MASTADILRTISITINAGVNASGITTPGQVLVGWPTASKLAAIIGNGEWLITLYPQKTRPATRYKTNPGFLVVPPPCPLVATVTPTSLTTQTLAFSGSNAAGLNIHTIIGPRTGAKDTLYQTNGSESLVQIATTVAGLINTAAAANVSAAQSGGSVIITGPYPVHCNTAQPIGPVGVSGYSTYVQEVARFERDIQCTVWAATPDIGSGNNDASREALENAMVNSIGGRDQPYQHAPDMSSFSALWQSIGDWSDQAESSYSVFRSDNYLLINYALLKPATSVPIGVVEPVTQIGSAAAVTQIYGGP